MSSGIPQTRERAWESEIEPSVGSTGSERSVKLSVRLEHVWQVRQVVATHSAPQNMSVMRLGTAGAGGTGERAVGKAGRSSVSDGGIADASEDSRASVFAAADASGAEAVGAVGRAGADVTRAGAGADAGPGTAVTETEPGVADVSGGADMTGGAGAGAGPDRAGARNAATDSRPGIVGCERATGALARGGGGDGVV